MHMLLVLLAKKVANDAMNSVPYEFTNDTPVEAGGPPGGGNHKRFRYLPFASRAKYLFAVRPVSVPRKIQAFS